MQNYKKYAIPPAQLIIADVPYNVGKNFYGSNPMWYNGGDNKNGESKFAGKAAFNSDFNFNLYEYFHFCSKMLKKDDKKSVNRGRSSDSPCMIVFCSFEQMPTLIDAAKKHGFIHYIPLVFVKNYSPQVLKATDLGYEVQFRELVAADYGAPTMRKRFFLVARCDGKPIVWPEPTHAPADSDEVKAGLPDLCVAKRTPNMKISAEETGQLKFA